MKSMTKIAVSLYGFIAVLGISNVDTQNQVDLEFFLHYINNFEIS